MLPWKWKTFTHVHHIAVYYVVSKKGGELSTPEQFKGQDSLGAVWVTKQDITKDNASPLVHKAFEWIESKHLGIDAVCYSQWEVKEV